jgi:Uncharacterized protein conserved in bacteria (DUF2252)
LGWHYFPNSPRPDYYVRQLRDWKGSIEISALDPKSLAMYAGYFARLETAAAAGQIAVERGF